MFEASVDRMDAQLTLRAVNVCARQQMQAECSVLELAALYADLHPAETLSVQPVTAGSAGRLSRGAGEQALQLGGEGTPLVAEFAIADLAAAMEDTTNRARTVMAAALDLRHRLPLLWRRVCEGNVRAWMVIKVAEATRTLTPDAARAIDAQVVDQVSTMPWARFEESLRAKVIAADPDRARRLIRRAKDEIFVTISNDARWGTKTIHARVNANDADQLDSMINKLSGIIVDEPHQTDDEAMVEDDHSRYQRLRARALGRLGNPLHALRTLAEDAQPELFETDPDLSHPSEPDADRPARERISLWEWLRQINPRKLLPRATLHVHIAHDALAPSRSADAVTRVEGIGPILGSQVREWLQASQVTVRPVVDLANIRSVDAYEVPATIRAALYDRNPVSCYPWSNQTGRHLDADHTRPYRRRRPDEPPQPGQTGLHNLGLLGRSEHRLKTHGHWQVRQAEPGTYVWRTRYGRVIIVNDTGTHDLGDQQLAQTLWHAIANQDHQLMATAG